uniref:Inhibitor_I29 domain-containing protein n=1 Tax=Heterorhabditis bacteriophora TaxID=37862 RepID=A0A1I7XHS1_HETBA
MAVSTSSEECNEVARQYSEFMDIFLQTANSGAIFHTLHSTGFTVVSCHHKPSSEWDRGSLSGRVCQRVETTNRAKPRKEDHCSYTEGYERIGNNEEVLGNILSAIQHDLTNELLGAYSVATPGEMITMITFFKKVINVSEWERLKFILRDMDLGRMVVELSLARAIKALELHLLAMDDSTTWLFNNKELAVRKAGEVIDRTSYREALFKLLNAFKRDYSKQNNNFNRFNKFLREEMESVFKDEPEYFGKFDKYDEWNKYQNYSQGDWRSATANEVAGLKICVAKYPSMGVMATETLNEMNCEIKMTDSNILLLK